MGIVPILFRKGSLMMPDFEDFKNETPEKNNSPISPFHKREEFQKVKSDF